jgi:hypothetical protein
VQTSIRAGLALCTVALLGLPTPVSAAPTPEFALSVSPTRLVVDPSQIDDDQHFEVSNYGNRPVGVVVSKRAFIAGQDGTMAMTADAPYSATNWVTVVPERFDLAPGATAPVTVRIAVPAEPEPGDHQVALVFLVPATDKAKNIQLNRGIGTPIFITVPGVIDDTTKIAGLDAPRFALRGGPVTFTATIRDTGTVHRDFRAGDRLTIAVDGQKVDLPEFTVLRGSDRVVTSTWADPPMWCSCRAVLSMSHADGSVQHSTVKILVMPLHLIFYLLVAIVVLLVAGWITRRRYRAQVLAAARTMHDAAG